MVATIWSKPGCVWCDRAKDLLTRESIPYVEKNIATNSSKEELMEAIPGVRTLPQISLDGVLIGGYQELYNHLYKKT
jgi:glutaredoxin 3